MKNKTILLPNSEFKYLYKCNKCGKELAMNDIESCGEIHDIDGCDGWLVLIADMIPSRRHNLQDLLNFAYLHEINIQFNYLWDSCIDVKIGDDCNGYKKEDNILIGDLAEWLFRNLKEVYPELDWDHYNAK